MTVRDLVITLLNYDMSSKVVFELNGVEDVPVFSFDGVERDVVTNEVFILLSN